MSRSSLPAPQPVPVEHVAPRFREERAWTAYDNANPRREINVLAVNEYGARVAAGIRLGVDAWRVRVRPALNSLGLA